MRFEDEQYVRLYKRDTTTWLMLNWQGRCVLPLVLRKVDRAGILDLGEYGVGAIAAHIQVPAEVVEEGMKSILKLKILTLRDDGLLVWPKFIEAQEAKQSDKARQKAARERARDLAAAAAKGVAVLDEGAPDSQPPSSQPSTAIDRQVTQRDETVTQRDAAVTGRDGTVTPSHTASHGVTLSCAVLCSAKQSSAVGVQGAAHSAEASAEPPILRVQDGTGEPKPGKRGRLPQTFMREDWKPKPEHAEYVRARGLDLDAVVEDFRNHWLAEGKLGANWDARFKQNVDRILRTEWLAAKFAAPETPGDAAPAKDYGPPADPTPEQTEILQRILAPPKPATPLLAEAQAADVGAPVFWAPKSKPRAGGAP